MRCSSRPHGRRWAMFNAVGIAGLLFQLACLALLKHVLGLHYLAATVVAIELTDPAQLLVARAMDVGGSTGLARQPDAEAGAVPPHQRGRLARRKRRRDGGTGRDRAPQLPGRQRHRRRRVRAGELRLERPGRLRAGGLRGAVVAGCSGAGQRRRSPCGRGGRIRSLCASHRNAAGQGDERYIAVSLDRPAAGGAAGAGAGETSPRRDRRQPAANARWRRRGERFTTPCATTGSAPSWCPAPGWTTSSR